MKLAKLRRKHINEPIWHVQLAVAAAILLQFSLSSELVIGSKNLILALETLLFVGLMVIGPRIHDKHRQIKYAASLVLLGIIVASNVFSLILVIHALFHGGVTSSTSLIYSGVSIYLTNIIVFGIVYWELDEGQDNASPQEPDFLFAQTAQQNKTWQPSFFDYLYVSITNGSAFSPTDTLPLTHRAKLLMSLQAFISLATIALVAARAVNILL